MKKADWVAVPIQPSAFDIGATEKAVHRERIFVTMVGMRVDLRTKCTIKPQESLDNADSPVMTSLRGGRIYIQAGIRHAACAGQTRPCGDGRPCCTG